MTDRKPTREDAYQQLKTDLFNFTQSKCKPWLNRNGELFIDCGEPPRTFRIPPEASSKRLKGFIRSCYRELTQGQIANSELITDIHDEITHLARLNAPTVASFNRVACNEDETEVYVDYGQNSPVIRITEYGYGPDVDMHVYWERGKGQLPLCEPKEQDINKPLTLLDLLRPHFHCKEDDLILIAGWIIGCFKPSGPYPVLLVSGYQGSAKSTTVMRLKQIIDNCGNSAKVKQQMDSRDLVSLVRSNYVISLENLSRIDGWLSDSLCSIATGTGSIGGRTLYTNDEDSSFTACRPIILNGITDFVERGDLIDRCIQIRLSPIPEGEYKDDDTLRREFDKDLPYIMASVYSHVSVALEKYPATFLDWAPRMSNFARWAVASCVHPNFLDIFKANRESSVVNLLDLDPTAVAIRRLLHEKKQHQYRYAIGELLELLQEYKPIGGMKSGFPYTPRGLSNALMRLAPLFKKDGIEIYYEGRTNRITSGIYKGQTAVEINVT